jgi:hypothetical protein
VVSVSLLALGFLKCLANKGSSWLGKFRDEWAPSIAEKCVPLVTMRFDVATVLSKATKCAISCTSVIRNRYLLRLPFTVISCFPLCPFYNLHDVDRSLTIRCTPCVTISSKAGLTAWSGRNLARYRSMDWVKDLLRILATLFRWNRYCLLGEIKNILPCLQPK